MLASFSEPEAWARACTASIDSANSISVPFGTFHQSHFFLHLLLITDRAVIDFHHTCVRDNPERKVRYIRAHSERARRVVLCTWNNRASVLLQNFTAVNW